MKNVKAILGRSKIHFAEINMEALANADALLIATEWNEFRTPDFDRISSVLKNKVIFDGRNLFDLNRMETMGYHYESVGRRKISK